MKKIAVIFFSAIAVTGFAQQRLSLSDAINTALKNSYDIQLVKNNLEISSINNNYRRCGRFAPCDRNNYNDNEQLTTINQKFAIRHVILNVAMLAPIT
jgi:outer membrane protein